MRAGHHEELTSGLLPAALEVVNRASAAFGLEGRYPFADRRLMEFCLALPPTQRFRRGQTRGILRRAMRDTLPDAIRNRNTKGNLSHALYHSLRSHASPGLHGFMQDRLPIAADYIDVGAVRDLHRRFRDGGAPGQACMTLWQAVVLVRWLEREQEAVHDQERPVGIGPPNTGGSFVHAA